MQLTPAQAQIACDTHRFRVVLAGRRFGKTTLSAWEMFAKAIATNDGRVAYIAPTFQQARDIAWAELKKVTEPLALSVNESRLEITIRNKYGNKSLIILRGWESVETMRGQFYDMLILDEVASMRDFWVGWNAVLSPTLVDKKGEAMFISTPKGFNHFYDLFNLSLTDPNFTSFKFTTYDNPYIPVEEIEREKSTKPDYVFNQEYMGSFTKAEGLVYLEFDRDKHVTDKLPEMVVETLAGADFGYRNPTAVITVKKDYEGIYWVTDEWYKTEQTEDQVVEYIASQKFNKVYPDPENASAIESLRKKGVNTRNVNKGKGSIIAGVNKVIEALKEGKIRIHKSCVNVIQEFEMYSYPEDKGRNLTELPAPEHNHAMDALRYVIMMDGGYSDAPRVNYGTSRSYGGRISTNKLMR